MKSRAPLLVLLALTVLGGCESTTTPDAAAGDPDVLADAVLTALTAGSDVRAADRGALLHRLLRRTLHVVADEHGAEAARTAADRLRELAGAVRAARDAGDREAYRAAVLAFETAEARLVVRVLGDAPVVRILRSDAQELEALRQRAERVEAGGGDASPIRRILRATVPDYRTARQAYGDGDRVTALRLGAHVHDLLRRAGT